MNTTEQGKPQGPVTVQVGESGVYQVTVFPIREGLGILESEVAYTDEIAVVLTASTTGVAMYIIDESLSYCMHVEDL